MRDVAALDTGILFREYLTVCNEALARNRGRELLESVFRLGERLLGGRDLGVAVYLEDPATPYDFFTVRWSEGQFDLVAHGRKEPELSWSVKRSYLEDVVADPETYVANPARLDWEWVLARLGLTGSSPRGGV